MTSIGMRCCISSLNAPNRLLCSEKWGQAARIVYNQPAEPVRLRQHLLQHQHVDVDQVVLEKLQGANRQVVIDQPPSGKFVTPASINGFIFYSKSSEISANRRDDQDGDFLALRLLRRCLVYINTLMFQEILAEPQWVARMTPDDLRAITPYGSFDLDMAKRLNIAVPTITLN